MFFLSSADFLQNKFSEKFFKEYHQSIKLFESRSGQFCQAYLVPNCLQRLKGQNIGPDLDPNCLTLMLFMKEFFEKVNFEQNQETTKDHGKIF